MSLKWTILATVGILAMAIAALVGAEVILQPSSAQRPQIASGVWGLAGLLVVGVWAWFSVQRKRRGQAATESDVKRRSGRKKQADKGGSSSVSLTCPSCDRKMKVNASLTGRKVRCPKCKKAVRVPEAEERDEEDE